MDYNSTVNVLAEAGVLMAYVSALTIGSMQIFKQFKIAKRFIPVITLVVAVAITFLFTATVSATTGLIGFVSGLTAMGLFSGSKASMEK